MKKKVSRILALALVAALLSAIPASAETTKLVIWGHQEEVWNDNYKKIADEYNCIFVDAGSCEVSRDDCIHLTEEGHAQLAALITTAIKGIEPDHEWLDYRADMIGAGRF